MKVLVTGGAGYIGSHTVLELLDAGYDVCIVDDLSGADERAVAALGALSDHRVAFGRFDVADEAALARFVEAQGDIGGVVHFAAHKHVAHSHARPLDYYKNNLGALMSVLSCMRRLRIGAIVYSSSATVYGDGAPSVLSESLASARPLSPYGNTKKVGEEILDDVTRAHGHRAVALRYFNPCGAHPSGLLGERASGDGDHLVAAICRVALGESPRLRIYGADYPTRDGTPERDYVHVVDVAQAHVRALRWLLSAGPAGMTAFNLGTGRASTVLEVVRAFEACTGASVPVELAPRRQGDAASLVADCARARDAFGWSAQRTLEHMLTSAFEWHKRTRT